VAVATALRPDGSGDVPPGVLEAWYTCTAFATSTATFQVNGRSWQVESVASGGAPTTERGRPSGFTGTHTGIDPRVANYVELFGTWSASAAGNTTTLQQMLLWGLN
jgi:hypothetical protein